MSEDNKVTLKCPPDCECTTRLKQRIEEQEVELTKAAQLIAEALVIVDYMEADLAEAHTVLSKKCSTIVAHERKLVDIEVERDDLLAENHDLGTMLEQWRTLFRPLLEDNESEVDW